MKTQRQMCYDASRKAAAMDVAIMELINCRENPMTRADLAALIKRRPDVYGKYAGLVDKLPE